MIVFIPGGQVIWSRWLRWCLEKLEHRQAAESSFCLLRHRRDRYSFYYIDIILVFPFCTLTMSVYSLQRNKKKVKVCLFLGNWGLILLANSFTCYQLINWARFHTTLRLFRPVSKWYLLVSRTGTGRTGPALGDSNSAGIFFLLMLRPYLYGLGYPRQRPSLPRQLYWAFIWEKGVLASRVKVDFPWLFIKLFNIQNSQISFFVWVFFIYSISVGFGAVYVAFEM